MSVRGKSSVTPSPKRDKAPGLKLALGALPRCYVPAYLVSLAPFDLLPLFNGRAPSSQRTRKSDEQVLTIMASSLATSSAPQWQVDISGLSQLILNVGAHGLKQLALAGVDIHSIGCMLMIAEFTPASPAFRKKITSARNAQRSERLWLYKVVEIGASTNFLADQLLKTRAGENVLALLAATVPVMDEDTCTAALTALFEGANVSLDNIPGISQLRAIRTDLAPLSRKVGFGEKVLNYHKFLWSLQGNHQGTMPIVDPYFAIPLAGDIASIIRMLHKVATNEEPYILICWGLRGAAWITAYASEVLGLPVCALQKDRTPIPVTGAYENAKVLIELPSEESKCSLYLRKDLQDQIELGDEDSGSRRGWSVDCSVFNFLEYHHSEISKSKLMKRLSAFTALETFNLASTLSTWVANSPHSNRAMKEIFPEAAKWGFVSYSEFELQQIQARSLRILRQLGFHSGEFEDYEFMPLNGCPTYIATGQLSDSQPLENQSEPGCDDEVVLSPDVFQYGQYIPYGSHPELTNLDRLRYYIGDPQEQGLYVPSPGPNPNPKPEDNFLNWTEDMQRSLMRTIRIATKFASYLAFSDWDVSLRQMSVKFLRYGETLENITTNRFYEAHIPTAITFCTDGVGTSTLESRLWSLDWVAFELDGFIVYRNTARHQSIHELGGKFLGFSVGKIFYEGNACSKVRSDLAGEQYMSEGTEIPLSKITEYSRTPKYGIDASVRTLLSAIKDTLFVRLEVSLQSGLTFLGDASKVGSSLPYALVSTPCLHGYEQDFESLPIQERENIYFKPWLDMRSTTWMCYLQGIFFDPLVGWNSPNKKDARLRVFYQLVDNRPLQQWLACHWSTIHSPFQVTIIQKDCCFACIMTRIIQLRKAMEASNVPLNSDCLEVYVIPGGIQSQAQPTEEHGAADVSGAHTSVELPIVPQYPPTHLQKGIPPRPSGVPYHAWYEMHMMVD